MKPLLILLLFPFLVLAQDVEPVVSKDYIQLIKDSSQAKTFLIDTTNNVKNSFLRLNSSYNGYSVKRIKVKKGYLKIVPATNKSLSISGNFNSTIEIKTINQLPVLQSNYVQGRSQNGTLVWQGPETGELFSYGPDINDLEFDGTNYAYDINGKLVSTGSGNGQAANMYRDNIFRTGRLLSQSLTVQGKYLAGGNQYFAKIKTGQSRENIFLKENKNRTHDFLVFLEAQIQSWKISSNWSAITNRFSNSNRNGFLNRVYQNSILTPVSFGNAQGSTIGSGQRSYSNAADNPFFLLNDNGNSFSQTHRTGSFVAEKKQTGVKFRIAQSIERLMPVSQEGYKPGTSFFQNGIAINRKQDNINYFLNPSVSIYIRYNDNNYNLHSTLSANYIYANNRSTIDYGNKLYKYQRSSHDVSLTYQTKYDNYNSEVGLNLENKVYASNTVTAKDFFMPGISGFARFSNIFNSDYLSAKLVSSFINFNSELPISTSFSQNNFVQYSAEQALQFFPLEEISGFDNLSPIRHKEWMARIELSYKNKLMLLAEVFNRDTRDDIFPVYENGSFNLKNLADHRNKGVELELSYRSYGKNLTTSNSVSFFTSKDIVTGVKDGYNYMPIAGFSNVNKALVEGKVLGAIVGNQYVKDNKNNVVIGTDGFPLVNNTASVIGNPTPDFVMKMNNNISWKRFTLNIDWEWKKGGDVWNGTQAVLDYYGRSQNSALLRNTTNYIFPGVSEGGHINNISVDFYDPNLPLQKNRWTRYGYTGVAEDYIQRADQVKINNVGLCYKLNLKKYIQTLAFALYANNIIAWTPYKGADSNQLLYDQANTNGLDFFNLPTVKTFGFNVSIQF